ncbi:hypothetical protein K438DRAFT_2019716 [Mycena galopus ATCC 62051]|nr:hypothetical protein K438DRAFT_2019716 [Mycena galopus ATCC 62051]
MSSKHIPRVSYAAAVSSSSKKRPHPASPASTAPSGSTSSTEQCAAPASSKSEAPLALTSWPLVSSTAPASAPRAVSPLAREHTPPSQTPPSSTNLSEADMKLARVLHGLTALRPHLGPQESETSYCQAALGPHFPSLPKQKQYTRVLHALVTLCTAESGHNLAAMAAFSSTGIKVFICQNGGRPFDEVKRHLEAVWVILQQVRHPVVLPNNSRNPNGVIPPEPASASELTDKLLDLAHIFVAPKAISRAKRDSEPLKLSTIGSRV